MTSLLAAEVYFEPGFSPEELDRLTQVLAGPMEEWINDTHRAARKHLAKYPRQKSVGSMECFDFAYTSTGQQLVGLRYVAFHRGNPFSDQCLVYIGGRDFILKKGEEIRNHLINQTKNQGAEAFIVEQQLR